MVPTMKYYTGFMIKGYVYDPDGINTDEKIDFLLKIRSSNDVKLKDYAEKFGCEFHQDHKRIHLYQK